MTKNKSTEQLIKVAMFSALIIIGAYIIVPLYPIPISLQSLFAIASGYYLSKKYSYTSVLIYIIIGLIGIPVFAGGKAGIQTIFSPSFGYILGFLAQTFYVRTKEKSLSKLKLFLMFMIASLIIYAFGIIYMIGFFKITNKAFDFGKILLTGVLIFLPGDVLKAIVFSLVTKKLEKFL